MRQKVVIFVIYMVVGQLVIAHLRLVDIWAEEGVCLGLANLAAYLFGER